MVVVGRSLDTIGRDGQSIEKTLQMSRCQTNTIVKMKLVIDDERMSNRWLQSIKQECGYMVREGACERLNNGIR